MDIEKLALRRFTAKRYDPTKKIPDHIINQLVDLLRYTPTSINSQPYHFIVASTENGIKRVASSMVREEFLYNKHKVDRASHTIVICSKTDMDEAYIRKIIEQEIKDGRHNPNLNKEEFINLYIGYMNLHKKILKDLPNWTAKQGYIALGNLLLGASLANIDASPIEGFDADIIDKEFHLKEKGFTSILVITLGYHDETDYNAKQPKSRFPKEELFTFC
ncbi:oxygen-insensitive NAD(P)H nitroreductase [Commensalibacter sp. ESL0382]|uniref:oxygen-insensitive NAD(P)H nitroreductase n=1 Tax=unclassified Commensalibacter TaxID=2630218 RepID=UPI0012D85587|nr:oxygen-insensitive NAD(P)H nitroreductase [Commensalibacter sp. ESL0382]MCT6852602.1 oxygen-insensitive NAD(P)H nitroreductase [Commensalibacter sp.]MUG34116.1 oxygen-insensitive NAD(P)H nitroreductase [Commensalibacter sp. ESL0382]